MENERLNLLYQMDVLINEFTRHRTVGNGKKGIKIDDVFIKPSFKNNALYIQYTLIPTGERMVECRIVARIRKNGDSVICREIKSPLITMSDKRTQITLECSWVGMELWWPDSPVLYVLESTLTAADDNRSELLDSEQHRFGFREVAIHDGHYHFNGVRVNFWGDCTSLLQWKRLLPLEPSKQDWNNTVLRMKELNIRIFRWPSPLLPQKLIESCDELGMLIEAQSPLCWQEDWKKCNKSDFLSKAKVLLEGWILRYRNCTSIVQWGIETRMGVGGENWLTPEELRWLGEITRQLDDTRIITFEGDGYIEDSTVNHHHPELPHGEPVEQLYRWKRLLYPGMPTGIGELLTTEVSDLLPRSITTRNRWWLGICFRALRHMGFQDIKASCFWFALKENETRCSQNLRFAFSPILVFDVDYINEGIAPFLDDQYPVLEEGRVLKRNLVLLNDSFSMEHLVVHVVLTSDGKNYAWGSGSFSVLPGTSIEIPYLFEVPSIGEGVLDLCFSVYNGDNIVFRDNIKFYTVDHGYRGQNLDEIRLGENIEEMASSVVQLVGPPPQRKQISLNGVWDGNIVIPQYGGVELNHEIYSRKVWIPKEWSGKRIMLEFTAVNFIADIYINKSHIFHHIGGWIPFRVDITKEVKAGSEFLLEVEVKNMLHPPIVDTDGYAMWPIGGRPQPKFAGIVDDVWLRAYGNVHIRETYIITSYREKKIRVEYLLINTTSIEVCIELQAKVRLQGSDKVEKSLQMDSILIGAGEEKKVVLEESWQNPKLWWPHSPTLYILESKLQVGEEVLDEERRRFGFREIWIKGNQYVLNGIRINLWGDYNPFGGTHYIQPEECTPQSWPQTLLKMKSFNIRILRWHMRPAPRYTLDASDELGMLIVYESPIYGCRYIKRDHVDTYLENCKRWLEPWIIGFRNHPSIVMWGAENEMGIAAHAIMSPAQIRSLGETIRKYDRTRIICYDGDEYVGDETVNYHYPEGYNLEPTGSIYSWKRLVYPNKPTGVGEMLHTKSPHPQHSYAMERNKWWLGIWIRGMRYVGFADIRPACYWFLSKMPNTVLGRNLRNAFAPVALFDKAYDDLGIEPFLKGSYPLLQAGAWEERSLVLYNDEFEDPYVEVEVQIRSNGRTLALNKKVYEVPLGEHIEFTCRLQVPFLENGEAEVVLITRKQGKERFREIKRYQVSSKEPLANSCSIELGRGRLVYSWYPG